MAEVKEVEERAAQIAQMAAAPEEADGNSKQITLADRTRSIEATGGGELLGVKFGTVADMVEFAKAMSMADSAVPPHLRKNPGNCLAIVVRAVELKMSPFALANWSYEVDNMGTKRVAYESQFYHAVIESRAPIKGRIKYEIIGEGDERRCKVWATFKGDDEPTYYTSETLGKLRPDVNQNGKVKGSPLWVTKPELQLFYNAVRDWARIHIPDVLGGLYAVDEIEELPVEAPRDVSPETTGLATRLRDTKRRRANHGAAGFDAEHVAREVGLGGGTVIEGEATRKMTHDKDPAQATGEVAGEGSPETATTAGGEPDKSTTADGGSTGGAE